jgi:hypothetical protein
VQVEGDGLLIACVHGPEEVVAIEFGLPPGAQRIGRPGRLDLDDVGAHVAEQPAGERAGYQRADLDHPDAVKCSNSRHIAGHGASVRPGRRRRDCPQIAIRPDFAISGQARNATLARSLWRRLASGIARETCGN